ncbi:MAG: hypothetical protein H6742_18740 [Alphaproteobacteria bacterium]|nr:hypothetical protein [Alphaproteobacteria bacterium]
MTQLQALGLTLLFELPVVALLCARWKPDWARLMVVAAAASLVTHPFAWHGIRALQAATGSFAVAAAVGEPLVALVEGLLYAKVAGLGWRRGLFVGAAANAFSFGLGLVLSRAGWL